MYECTYLIRKKYTKHTNTHAAYHTHTNTHMEKLVLLPLTNVQRILSVYGYVSLCEMRVCSIRRNIINK